MKNQDDRDHESSHLRRGMHMSASELGGAGALRGAHAGSALALPCTAFPTTLAIKLRSAAPARVGVEGAVVQPGAVWVRASAARTFRHKPSDLADRIEVPAGQSAEALWQARNRGYLN